MFILQTYGLKYVDLSTQKIDPVIEAVTRSTFISLMLTYLTLLFESSILAQLKRIENTAGQYLLLVIRSIVCHDRPSEPMAVPTSS